MVGEGAGRPGSGLRADKHAAIMAGGREVFARDGFARASIDAIASASGVSTRTIYKHFADKSALFAAVIADSARRVAEEETALIERYLSSITAADEVEPTLTAFATAWLTGAARSEPHRALIGQVHAEAGHLGTEVVTAWWEAGPGRVRAELASAFAGLAAAGLLGGLHPERAATHFSQLVSAAPGPPASPPEAGERAAWIADGVRVFVRGYAP